MTIESVIRSSAIEIKPRIELRTLTGGGVADITERVDVAGAKVTRSSKDKVQGRFTCKIRGSLDWTASMLAPHIKMRDVFTGEEYEWALGRYLLETPVESVEHQDFHEVTGYDLISIYNTPVLNEYHVSQNQDIMGGLRVFLTDDDLWGDVQTEWAVPLDGVRASHRREWLFNEKPTYLSIANDILRSNGFRELHTGRDGRLRAEPRVAQWVRPAAWAFDSSLPNTVVSARSKLRSDTWKVPNAWLGVSDNPTSAAMPVDGNGRYLLVNARTGITSVEHRGRRVNKLITGTFETHADLIAAVEYEAERDVSSILKVELECSPCPVLWYDTVVTANIPQFDPVVRRKMVARSWSLPLDGSPMSVELEVLEEIA